MKFRNKRSFSDIDVDAEVSLLFNVGFQVRHLEVIVHPVDNEVRKPWVLALALEKTTEQFEAVLAEMVSKNLE